MNALALERVVDMCRRHFPDLRLGLLVNEGCLPDCPFKPAHDAHIAGTFDGNLLDLLDAPHDLSHRLWIDNRLLPTDLAARLSACPPVCDGCDRCARMHRRCARPRPLHLPTMAEAG